MGRNSTTRTLCLGLPQFIDKTGYQAQVYARHGEAVRFVVPDVNGQSAGFRARYGADVLIVRNTVRGKMWGALRSLWSFRPDNIELYLTGRMSLAYALLARIAGRRLIVFLRGMELDEKGLVLWCHKAALRLAGVVVAKEFNLVDDACGLRLGLKTHMLHNCVPPAGITPAGYDGRDIDVLFVNTPRRMRNVLFLVDVIAELLARQPGLRVVMAGFAVLDDRANLIEPDYQRQVLARIADMGLEGRIGLYGFVDGAAGLMARSRVFVLPADVVYCNYSLLESMSHGCVPVVADGEGASLIVEHGRNGMVCGLDVGAYADAVESMLRPSAWRVCSRRAVAKIAEEFSMDYWYGRICRIRASAGMPSNQAPHVAAGRPGMVDVSVVVPSFRPDESRLRQCLQSLFRQTLEKDRYEVIVVINGCCEPYLSMVQDIKGRGRGCRVKIAHTAEPGVSNARNIGLTMSEGRYIAFVDDDDYVSDGYLRSLLAAASPDTVTMSDALRFTDSAGDVPPEECRYHAEWQAGRRRRSPGFVAARLHMYVPHMKLIPRSVIGDWRFNTRFRNGQDTVFMYAVSYGIAGVRFADGDAVYYFRRRDDSLSNGLTLRGLVACKAGICLEIARLWARRPFSYSLPFTLSVFAGAARSVARGCLGRLSSLLRRRRD